MRIGSTCLTAALLFTARTSARSQTAAPPDPLALSVETRRLEFLVAASASQGSITDQLSALAADVGRKAAGARLAKLRVFVADSAELDVARRIVSTSFASGASKLVVSFVGVRGFPQSGQRVAADFVVERPAVVASNGLALIAGVAGPTVDRMMTGLRRVLTENAIDSSSVRRVSCFYENPALLEPARAAVTSAFSNAEVIYVYSFAPTDSTPPAIECEAIARLTTAPSEPMQIIRGFKGRNASPYYSLAALVNTPRLVLTGGQGGASTESALRQAFNELAGAVDRAGGRMSNVLLGDNYWTTGPARDQLRALRGEYFSGSVPAATGVFVTSLAGHATASMDLIIGVPQ